MKKSNALELLSDETVYAATGTFPQRDSQTVQATALRQKNANFRASEAILRDPNLEPIHLVQALITRGFLDEAESKIIKLLENDLPPELAIEVRVENARLRSYLGDWSGAIEICSDLERNFQLQALNQMTVLQISANALFELGEFHKAAVCYQRIDTYTALFPHGQIPFYARLHYLKNLSRLHSEEATRDLAEQEWKLWKKNISTANLDQLHAWIRLKIDRARLAGQPHRELALANVQLAQALGDETYLGIAWIDLQAALTDQDRAKFRSRIENAARLQPRAQRLLSEIENGNQPISETARSIRDFPAASRESLPHSFVPEGMENLLLLESGIQIDLKELRMSAVEMQPRSKAILSLLKESEIEKSPFFEKIWGLRFRSGQHDTVIRAALSRTRDQSGIRIECEANRIRIAPKTLILSI